MQKSDNAEQRIANIVPFGLRMQPDLKRRVEQAARNNGRSLNSEISARLEWSFQHEMQAGGGQDDHEARIASLEVQMQDALVPDFVTPQLIARIDELAKEVEELKRR